MDSISTHQLLAEYQSAWYEREVQIVLIGFLSNLASHLGRSPSIHSNGYGFSADRPTCLARFPRNPDPFMQRAG